MFKWCIAKQWRADDPADLAIVRALPNQKKIVTHRKSIGYNEVSEFLETVSKSSAGLSTKLSLEFLPRLLYPLMCLMETLRHLKDARLEDLRALYGTSNPIHGICRKAKATFRLELFGSPDKRLLV